MSSKPVVSLSFIPSLLESHRVLQILNPMLVSHRRLQVFNFQWIVFEDRNKSISLTIIQFDWWLYVYFYCRHLHVYLREIVKSACIWAKNNILEFDLRLCFINLELVSAMVKLFLNFRITHFSQFLQVKLENCRLARFQHHHVSLNQAVHFIIFILEIQIIDLLIHKRHETSISRDFLVLIACQTLIKNV